ncbi:MAG: tRNA (guanosine(46)-N7)-methyltransferase TrmB [Candidatus Thiodiazotropha lotti]|uniref:tRNA (guanine-N(7)-)-methyltransferase n=1 Tax=Candidatus Thiodiazotropha lotti TaxID=2792787 RepID=A0A9E4MZQ8_9GAMM|nr:tRNA (guanosine(46)-N7)-methyltransferase TrmB [Candidatus Thiodiazotropha lotti]ODC00089.1 tRNA (guanosine(46)-N7)-methyltransferase TrmB [Candidatus Thiodiazotropha endoloripes]MCG7922272.1 tRNA (guanosine(46)-N7)-methyltransferase TrmB [Candidatus Thiodiazotropha lotti]MCG7931441.1 tRNA (guanosine(46)-N7)-methyltransferase TrmB [Candidatus Thiodiazotropha lotti]MCG7939076.1 tRNA (guanosine(46)-N7)-methyltransferase TrmB [Candidatus Thiodiazotropha lotti]
MPQSDQKSRPIRSYVLRQGRMTEGQQKAYEALWPRYGVELDGDQLDLSGPFEQTQPVTLEIGFGNGESLRQLAQKQPEQNFLGIEVHGPGVGHLMIQLQQYQLSNVRILKHDAMELLRHHLQPGSLQRVLLYFPDPWHKRKHNKRRIVQDEFAELVHRALIPGGILHMATDWEDYARQMMNVLSAHPGFNNQAGEGNFSPRPETRPLTKFEQRGERLGHGVWDLLFERLA